MDTEIIIVLAASVFVFCLLMFLFNFVLKYQKKTISFAKEKELMQAKFDQILLQSQMEVQESTFSILSQELHDNIGQLLSSAKMFLGLTERTIANPPDSLITATDIVGKAINELRSLSKSLNKEWLEQFDLIKNLKTEVERINSSKTMRINVSHPEQLTIKADNQIILFRIIQEAIQNSIKHAFAENICISIYCENNELITKIKDNGGGFIKDKAADGIGLLNMKQRAKSLGGTIEWDSSNQGSSVLITLPVRIEECEAFP